MTEIDYIFEALNPWLICIVCLKSFITYDCSLICDNCKEKGFQEA